MEGTILHLLMIVDQINYEAVIYGVISGQIEKIQIKTGMDACARMTTWLQGGALR
jgi:hypothetical protein